MYDEKPQSGVLSVIVTLSVIIGALASLVAVMYVFREKLGIDKLIEKYRRDEQKWENCCCYTDDSDETSSEIDVTAEA